MLLLHLYLAPSYSINQPYQFVFMSPQKKLFLCLLVPSDGFTKIRIASQNSCMPPPGQRWWSTGCSLAGGGKLFQAS